MRRTVRSGRIWSAAITDRFWPIGVMPLGLLPTQSGNPSSYKAVIEANEGGRSAVEKLEPFHPGLVVIATVRGGHLKGALWTPHVPV